jgi:hypothetical protein
MDAMIKLRFFPFIVGLLWVGLCSHPLLSQAQTPPVLNGDQAHPAKTRGWLDTRLYFGLGPADTPDQGVSESSWRAFLDKEVTPRFPAGLSVIDVYGQWQRKREAGDLAKTPGRIRSKMLMIDYPATRENFNRIEAIRTAWKQLTGDQSVLKVTQPVDVSF